MNFKFSTLALAAATLIGSLLPATAADLGPYPGSIKDGYASPHDYYRGGLFITGEVGQVWKGDFDFTVGAFNVGINVPRGPGWAWTPHVGYMASFSDETIDHGGGWSTTASFSAFKIMPLAFTASHGRWDFNLGAGYTHAWLEGTQDYKGSGCGCDPDEHLKLDVSGDFATLGGGLDFNVSNRVSLGAKYEYNVGLGDDTEDFQYIGGNLKFKF